MSALSEFNVEAIDEHVVRARGERTRVEIRCRAGRGVVVAGDLVRVTRAAHVDDRVEVGADVGGRDVEVADRARERDRVDLLGCECAAIGAAARCRVRACARCDRGRRERTRAGKRLCERTTVDQASRTIVA